VARWKANPKERLARAALELFAERGFDATTVADIVERADLTKSTFFRHFQDKREVLFGGQEDLLGVLNRSVADVPPGANTVACVEALLDALAERFDAQALDLAATRAAVIAAQPELRERDLLKRAQLEAAIRRALGARGVDDLTARLAAVMALLSFDGALDRWVGGTRTEAFGHVLRRTLGELLERAAALGDPASQACPSASLR